MTKTVGSSINRDQLDAIADRLAKCLTKAGMVPEKSIIVEIERGSKFNSQSWGLWYMSPSRGKVDIGPRHGIRIHGVYGSREVYNRIDAACDMLEAVIQKEATSGR